MFLAGTSCNGAALFWKGGGAASHLHLKIQAQKTASVCFHSKQAFSNDIINYLWELKLHRYILGTPETYITFCKKGHDMSTLRQICMHHIKKCLYKIQSTDDIFGMFMVRLCAKHLMTVQRSNTNSWTDLTILKALHSKQQAWDDHMAHVICLVTAPVGFTV